MKRMLSCFLTLVLLTGFFPQTALAAPDWPDQIVIQAEGGIVMEADSGTVLYGQNIHIPYFPASITKILTALVVLENSSMDEMVTFSHNAVFNVEAGSSSAGLDVGDQLSVRDCLYAMLLKSANEVANALAEHVAGSIETFAGMMNEKAAALGCQNSHFNNPSGLNDPNHYTTAYDMALIAQAAFRNEDFVEIDSTLYYDLPPTRWNPDGFRIYPGHKMLKKNTPQYYAGIIGGKTGYTSLAGNTLVTCAERDGMRLIAVILNGHQTHYIDTKTLLDFGFSNFTSLNVADHDTTYTSVKNDMTIAGLPAANLSVLQIQKDRQVILPKGADLSDTTSSITYELPANAPQHAVAQISYHYNDRKVGETYLIRSETSGGEYTPFMDNIETETQSAPDPDAKPNHEEPVTTAAGGTNADSGNLQGSDDGLPSHNDLDSDTNFHSDNPFGVDTPDSDTDSGSGFHLHIPEVFWIVLGVLAAAAALTGGVVLLKARIEKKEEAERMTRYQRRQQRLQDIGISTAEFDLLMQERRASSALKSGKKKRRLGRHKSFLDQKRF